MLYDDAPPPRPSYRTPILIFVALALACLAGAGLLAGSKAAAAPRDQEALRQALLGLSPAAVRGKLGEPQVDYVSHDLWQYERPTIDPRSGKNSRYVFVHFVFSRTEGTYGVDLVYFREQPPSPF